MGTSGGSLVRTPTMLPLVFDEIRRDCACTPERRSGPWRDRANRQCPGTTLCGSVAAFCIRILGHCQSDRGALLSCDSRLVSGGGRLDVCDIPGHDRPFEAGRDCWMLRCRLAVVFGALLLATPPMPPRCGGSFPAFVQSFSQEAAAAGIQQDVISQALGGGCSRMAGCSPSIGGGGGGQRYTFNKTFEQYVATRVGSGAHQWRPRDVAATRGAALEDRAALAACRARSWSRSGGWRPISARATWASCRCFRVLTTRGA